MQPIRAEHHSRDDASAGEVEANGLDDEDDFEADEDDEDDDLLEDDDYDF